MTVPIIPNAPLVSRQADENFGLISLRQNQITGLIENQSFDDSQICYDENYQNNQATSNVFSAHMHHVYEVLKRQFPVNSKLVEVGCGKGDFLNIVEADGHFKYAGYDFAYEGDNPNIHKRFLNENDQIDADIIVLRHVLEHIQKPHLFLAMLAQVFPYTPVYIEVPDYCWITDHAAFFDLTYEHVNYFTPNSLSKLFTSSMDSGLLFKHQYQYIIADLGSLLGDYTNHYNGDNWTTLDLKGIFKGMQNAIDSILELSASQNIVIWGGATKGVLFAHHLKTLAPDVFKRIRCAIDINPNKQNKFLPSTKLKIISDADFLAASNGDEIVVVMNPNYFDEIKLFLEQKDTSSYSLLSV
jgi:hypothetical protein